MQYQPCWLPGLLGIGAKQIAVYTAPQAFGPERVLGPDYRFLR
jgi:hypothetical protein